MVYILSQVHTKEHLITELYMYLYQTIKKILFRHVARTANKRDQPYNIYYFRIYIYRKKRCNLVYPSSNDDVRNDIKMLYEKENYV